MDEGPVRATLGIRQRGAENRSLELQMTLGQCQIARKRHGYHSAQKISNGYHWDQCLPSSAPWDWGSSSGQLRVPGRAAGSRKPTHHRRLEEYQAESVGMS
jgi:hypothetical protein